MQELNKLVYHFRSRIRENSDFLQGSEVSRRRLRIIATPKLRMDEALGDDVVDDVARDISESEITAAVLVGELLVVDPHEVEDRGV